MLSVASRPEAVDDFPSFSLPLADASSEAVAMAASLSSSEDEVVVVVVFSVEAVAEVPAAVVEDTADVVDDVVDVVVEVMGTGASEAALLLLTTKLVPRP